MLAMVAGFEDGDIVPFSNGIQTRPVEKLKSNPAVCWITKT